MISKQFVSVQEITDNMESSGANYVKLIQFSLPKEGQCREDRGEAVSVSHVLTVGRFMTVSHREWKMHLKVRLVSHKTGLGLYSNAAICIERAKMSS